jgi:hypothetical protein
MKDSSFATTVSKAIASAKKSGGGATSSLNKARKKALALAFGVKGK